MATTCKLIAKTSLTGTTSNIEFTSIPGTYTDLLVYISGRSNRASNPQDALKIQFNGDETGTAYSLRVLFGDGSTAQSGTETSVAYGGLYGCLTAATATADTFGNAYFYIPNYAGSTNKSVSGEGGSETNAATGVRIGASASLWSNTAAITSLKLTPYFGSFVSGTTAQLFGILKA